MTSDCASNQGATEQPPTAPQCPGNMGKARIFIEEVKARATPDRPELLTKFFEVFGEFYGKGQIPEAAVAVPPIHDKMREIFKDDPDLLEKFEEFLPRDT
ncbi:uncharacterized protein DNG_10075 [Cephalotrichum gorgonifer]|uniref:Uncharacterized protein n=1 Tax=Cephalotrichum gorgonifer TaxID=2041049 RepID=A0AAE8SZV7_9PEZI|nr:uncharacterized protein DNG_10075 [Cephalotrichum gorgonifer]